MIIIDNFIEDKNLLTKIAFDGEFWKPGYHWWGGWWNEDSQTTRHELISYIWRENCPIKDNIEIQGFEHWVGSYTAGENVIENFGERLHLKHHFDKDEKHWRNTGEVITPTLGTVFYPDPATDETEGGYLQLWDTYNIDPYVPYELIRPKFNRLIVFDAGKLHAVQEVTKGTRKAIAINLWAQAPSESKEMLY